MGEVVTIHGIDLETTGLSQAEGHRIVEVALIEVVFDPLTHRAKLTQQLVQRVNPERPIEPEAEAVHGISWMSLRDEPVWKDVAPRVADFMNRADVLVAHNMMFDGPFVAGELQREKLKLPAARTYCTMENARWATAMGKLPKLSELCFALEVDYDPSKAHAAEYDVQRTLICLMRGLRKGFYELPKKEMT